MTQPQPKYPKAVEFLRNAMLGKEGYDLGLAQELTKLVNDLGVASSQVEGLKEENGALRIAVEILSAPDDPEVFPQFPADFYVYGVDPLTHTPSDEDVQDMVSEAADVILEDGQYFETTDGDTIVIKMRDGDVDKLIVAQGYLEVILDDREDEDEDEDGEDEDEGCTFPDCDCPTQVGRGIGGFSF